MSTFSGTSELIPLPEFSPHAADPPPDGNSGLRRFGISEDDLAMDFTSPDRAALVTALLELCAYDPAGALPARFFRVLSIGKRIECLLTLAAGGRSSALSFPFKCGGCGEEIEFELTLEEVSSIQVRADAADIIAVDTGAARLTFRKPTGQDQEFWSGSSAIDGPVAASQIISTLAVEPAKNRAMDRETIAMIEAALDEADPLVDFHCNVSCGECGEWNQHEIDLTETALGLLQRAQDKLVITVHRLAAHYHWSEKEIFAVPERRRMQYLKLIEAGRK